MDRKLWEFDFEEQLEADYQNTTKSEFKDEAAFLNAKWQEHLDSLGEELILNHENNHRD